MFEDHAWPFLQAGKRAARCKRTQGRPLSCRLFYDRINLRPFISRRITREPVMSDDQQSPDQNTSKPTFFQTLASAIGAAIGVQRSDVRARDFQSDSPIPFIVAGLIVTLLFITTLLTVVFWVI